MNAYLSDLCINSDTIKNITSYKIESQGNDFDKLVIYFKTRFFWKQRKSFLVKRHENYVSQYNRYESYNEISPRLVRIMSELDTIIETNKGA